MWFLAVEQQQNSGCSASTQCPFDKPMLSSEPGCTHCASANIAVATLFDYKDLKSTVLIQLISLCHPRLRSKFNIGICTMPVITSYHSVGEVTLSYAGILVLSRKVY